MSQPNQYQTEEMKNSELFDVHPVYDLDVDVRKSDEKYLTKKIGKQIFVKNIRQLENKNICQINNRILMPMAQPKSYCRQSDFNRRYEKYGPNCIIFMGILHRVSIFILGCSVFVGAPLLFYNIYNSYQQCTANIECLIFKLFYSISLFNVGNEPHFLKVQIYFWLVVSVCICIYSLYLYIYVIQSYSEISNKFQTESTFSIIIKKVPQNTTNQEIQQFVENSLFEEVKKYQYFKQKKMYEIHEPQQFERIKGKIDEGLKQLLQIQYILRPVKMKDVYNQIENRVDKLSAMSEAQRKQQIRNDKNPKWSYKKVNFASLNPSQIAIVVFKNNKANDIIHQIITPKYYQNKCFHCIPYCIFQCCFLQRKQLQLNDEEVIISRAPEPEDLRWRHIGYTQFESISRRFCYSFFSVVMILINGLISYFIYKASKEAREGSLVVTLVLVMLTQVVNKILEVVLNWLIKSMKFLTNSREVKFKIIFMVTFQSLNLSVFNLMIPYLAELPDIKEGIIKANFPTFTIFSMITTFFRILINYTFADLQIYRLFMRWLLKIKCKCFKRVTQSKADTILKGVSVAFGNKYSQWITVFWFGLIFSIMSPICLFISTLVFGLAFVWERRLFNRVYTIPKAACISVPLTFVRLFQMTPIWLGIANLGFHKIIQMTNQAPLQTEVYIIDIIIILIGLIFSIFPWEQRFQKFGINIYSWPHKTYNQCKHKFQTTYKNADPSLIKSEVGKVEELFYDQSANQYRKIQKSRKLLQGNQ